MAQNLDEEQHPATLDPHQKAELSSGAEEEPLSDEDAFPEGGARAWSVAMGNAGVMFCTLGYVNSWG
jgi:hypothetical protein